ncbi:uncharacterized protein LOC116413323 [Galleria mellonella]|uniref:Uncharacterized protein LOC116413323 n=1 Tax=Galleria mellonella TaxID=7137 RepID=A0A6J3C4J0_GALME|nr:uncharacterized protein LOC116413323 [Galleria mellonella]
MNREGFSCVLKTFYNSYRSNIKLFLHFIIGYRKKKLITVLQDMLFKGIIVFLGIIHAVVSSFGFGVNTDTRQIIFRYNLVPRIPRFYWNQRVPDYDEYEHIDDWSCT